ncbi:uncharacterized protein Z520_09326 [Fonsecaea multimorphosa CBS 102226]|uniref:Uncharacterized protein n=1 Tax=Fonsecaea multimorphosa CBS 102226 TaxID=1442371 RepID=A0A0D2ID27_9EURO|nr:uncharacterized protein Z520_09326 [Fonsecaea multimorphosa CBS 102226]KIX95016.1 hypothetical protein Z520_09326 [Fonsecaea multimorphosa CBS 102226]
MALPITTISQTGSRGQTNQDKETAAEVLLRDMENRDNKDDVLPLLYLQSMEKRSSSKQDRVFEVCRPEKAAGIQGLPTYWGRLGQDDGEDMMLVSTHLEQRFVFDDQFAARACVV